MPLTPATDSRFIFGVPDQTDDYQLSNNRGVAPLITQSLMLIDFVDNDSATYGCEATNGAGDF